MDLNSPEFYTIAFVVAIALVALLIGHREKGPSSTYIMQMPTVPDENDSAEDTLRLTHMGGGRVLVERKGLTLGPEETVNLVFTINDDQCEIIEKKGIKRRGMTGIPVKGEVSVKCLRPIKYRIRFESQLTSTWASFTYDASSDQPKEVTLTF